MYKHETSCTILTMSCFSEMLCNLREGSLFPLKMGHKLLPVGKNHTIDCNAADAIECADGTTPGSRPASAAVTYAQILHAVEGSIK